MNIGLERIFYKLVLQFPLGDVFIVPRSARRRPMVKGDSTESSTNPFFTDGDEEEDDDESESDVGWPTEHPVKRKNERRGSRPRADEAAAMTSSSMLAAATATASAEKEITLPEWLIELPEDLEVHTTVLAISVLTKLCICSKIIFSSYNDLRRRG